MIFSLVFMIPGFAVLLIGVPVSFFKGEIMMEFFALIWGAMFGGAGLLMLKMGKPCVFDKMKGVYYFGKEHAPQAEEDRKTHGQLNDIYALQLLEERIRSGKGGSGSSYTSHEMNLVFEDGERVNVMDHGKGDQVVEDSKTLAEFLDVPIWQASY